MNNLKEYKQKKLTNKPLCENISGFYNYNEIKEEYKPKIRQIRNATKQIYSIRKGEHNKRLFINHTDYSVVQTYYTSNEQFIYFDYNNSNYSIELSEKKMVEIRKIS